MATPQTTSPLPPPEESAIAIDIVESNDIPSPEQNPWRNTSYICTTFQLMMTLLDLFMESGDIPAIHYTITVLQFCPALYLTIYQCVRIHAQKFSLRKHILILLIGLVLQLYVLIIAGMWFNINNDINSHNVEWSGKSALVLFYHMNSCVQYDVLLIYSHLVRTQFALI